MIRAYRTTLPRIAYSLPETTKEMRIIRRISAAFKDIPGGQVLGPTSDYTLRLLDFELFEETTNSRKTFDRFVKEELLRGRKLPKSFPKIVEILRQEGLLQPPTKGREMKAATPAFSTLPEMP